MAQPAKRSATYEDLMAASDLLVAEKLLETFRDDARVAAPPFTDLSFALDLIWQSKWLRKTA